MAHARGWPSMLAVGRELSVPPPMASAHGLAFSQHGGRGPGGGVPGAGVPQ